MRDDEDGLRTSVRTLGAEPRNVVMRMVRGCEDWVGSHTNSNVRCRNKDRSQTYTPAQMQSLRHCGRCITSLL